MDLNLIKDKFENTVKTIENTIICDFELNLDNYGILYLPNCIEIINSFKNENNSIIKIIAPKLAIIDAYVGMNFQKMKELIIPSINYISSPCITNNCNHNKLKIVTSNKFNSEYVIQDHSDSWTFNDKLNIYKDIDVNTSINYKNNEFYNCSIYNKCRESIFHDCNVLLFHVYEKTAGYYQNEFYNCEIPYLGVTVNRYGFSLDNEFIINALTTSNLFKYFKDTNDENLSDDEIINILKSHCILNDITNIKIKSFDDIVKNKDISHDLLYLQCNDLLDMVHFKLN